MMVIFYSLKCKRTTAGTYSGGYIISIFSRTRENTNFDRKTACKKKTPIKV